MNQQMTEIGYDVQKLPLGKLSKEMLKKGYLASNSIYACISHTEEIIDEYMHCLNRVFKLIKECEDGRNIETLLLGPICHAGFKRLN